MSQLILDKKTMYEGLVNKDTQFEGIFVVGVKTTGIFCRPTCSARKPKPENVDYFSSVEEAMQSGFRPCKICDPLQPHGAIPTWLKPLMEEIDNDPGIAVTDNDLKSRGIDPNRIRRWFKKHHGISFPNNCDCSWYDIVVP